MPTTATARGSSKLERALAARLGDHPIVLAFDDVHWSDESSASALHFVVRSNAERPLLCLLAARVDELRDNTAVSRAVRELRQARLLEASVDRELGQLAFIAAVLGVMALARRTRVLSWLERHALPVTAHAIGILAAFWFFERLAGFV
jgi:hypothetical protein